MKKLSFNILKYNQSSDEPLLVTEFDFWKYYLEILQIKAGSFLSDQECNMLAFVLSKEVNHSYFKAPKSNEIMEAFDLKVANFHRIKFSLKEKGLIVPTDIGGDYLLHPRMVEYQKTIKNKLREGISIEYFMKFKLKEDDTKQAN